MIARFGGALLLALAALPLSTAASAAERAVTFASLDGDLTGGAPTMLTGVMVTPDGAGPFPAIVLAHGCGGLHRGDGKAVRASYGWWAERFVQEGYVALLVDSFGLRGRRQVCVTEPDKPTITPGRERVRDVQGARAFLAGLSLVRADRIALMGWSNGGSTVLGAVATGAPARAADNDFVAAVAFYPGCFLQSKDSFWKPAIPTLILIGALDDWTPARHCEALADRLVGNPISLSLKVYPGAHHGFDAPNTPLRVRQGLNTRSGTATIGTNHSAREEAIDRALLFLGAALKP